MSTPETAVCQNCSAIFPTKKNCYNLYCNNSCQQAHRSRKIVENWLNGSESMYGKALNIRPSIRNFLLAEANYRCELCGWSKVNPRTGASPLEIDHTDGNYLNESRQNLRVLCPNCHSLTPTYKALNKGFGRESRRKSTP